MKSKVGADRISFKGTSLMGSISGPPSVVESDADGKITRIRPFYYDEGRDWESLNPWKIEARGSTFEPPRHSVPGVYYCGYKKRVYSENRVRYPLKRVDFDPKGERNPQNRGKSKYVRISWDEATQIIADELLRIREKYGMSAWLCEADMHGESKHVAPCHGCMNRLLSLLGGYTIQMRNNDSWEGWFWGSKNVWGCEPYGEMNSVSNCFPDIAAHTDTLLFWGADPETTAVGFDGYMASRLSYWLHSLGLKYIYIDPALNFSGVCQADKWIPVKPNTDAALQLGVIYTWLTEDLYDKEYVRTHAVGYEEFFDYVLGKVDGEPKTPAWASEKCGVPEWTIKALARDWASKVVSISHGNGGPYIRGPFCHEPARLEAIMLGMQGLGRPGVHQVKWVEWGFGSDHPPVPYMGEVVPDVQIRCELVRPVGEQFADNHKHGIPALNIATERAIADGDAYALEQINIAKDITKPMEQGSLQSIPRCLVQTAILEGHAEWYGLKSFTGPADEQWVKHEYPLPGCSKVHAIWTDSPCNVTCWNDGFDFVKAFRSPEIEFVVAQHPWLENDCYLADIILPVTTKYELDDICNDFGGGVFTSVYRERKSCDPIAESKSDFDAVAEIAKKLGDDIYDAYTVGRKTEEEVIEAFWYASGISGFDKNDDFHKKDMFVIPADPHIPDLPVALRSFHDDPDNHPLTTPTGKLEFTSTKFLEYFPDDEERPPYPKWVELSELHDERIGGERSKKYPLLCMSNHGRWRFHANLDDLTWSREVETMKIRGKDGYQYEPCWMNPAVVKARGINHGDIVKVYNERGIVLCAAYVTERLVEDTVYVDHGSRFDPIDAEGLDRGGAINLITPRAISSKNATGMVVSGFLVQVEKVTDEEMNTWKQKYPDSFARKVDEACGVCLDGWLLKD